MCFFNSRVVCVVAVFLALPSTRAWAHWCDDLWSSAYDIVVRPDSDTSPKALYVQNRWGYQLTNFKLTATSSSGGAVTLTPPTTLKVPNTLLPGEKGIWKITSGNPAKIEDLTFSVRFGDTSGMFATQYACYPVLDASPVMVVKNDGSLFPNAIKGIPKDGTDPKPNTPNGCTYGDVSLGRQLQVQTIADWEDLNVGLDNLLMLYCAGRGSWGSNDKSVKPTPYCKDASSTSCPTTKPMASPASRSDYMRLWGAGSLAIRKESLDARLPVFRERLKCGVNDGDTGVAGYTLFVLGYLGDDPGAKSFLQTQASAGGDVGTIAKAGLYLMGDTSQKDAVQAGTKSNSVFVKVACAGALGIVDKDDNAVTSVIIPEVKWIEPDNMGGTSDGGKGMYSAHILELVAMNRRGWVHRGNAEGPVTFYGETDSGGTGGASGKGGATGAGGATGPRGTGGTTGGRSGNGGALGSGGRSGTRAGSGGTDVSAVGGSTNSSQAAGGAEPQASGGVSDSGGSGSGGSNGSGGSVGQGGSSASGGSSGGSQTGDEKGQSGGCNCSFGGRSDVPALAFLALTGLALLVRRRRR